MSSSIFLVEESGSGEGNDCGVRFGQDPSSNEVSTWGNVEAEWWTNIQIYEYTNIQIYNIQIYEVRTWDKVESEKWTNILQSFSRILCWESVPRSAAALFAFVIGVWIFQIWMIPAALTALYIRYISLAPPHCR